MIARVRGEVIENHGTSVVIDCHGVGYEAMVPSSVAFQLVVGQQADLFVRHIVREDDQTLYGFSSPEQRKVFDLLREVKGCGPKISLAVLGDLGEGATLNAILAQDVRSLTRVSGIGQRMAERIIVELKDKVSEVSIGLRAAVNTTRTSVQHPDDELVDALLGLGYKRTEAEAAATAAIEQAETVEERLVAALRSLKR